MNQHAKFEVKASNQWEDLRYKFFFQKVRYFSSKVSNKFFDKLSFSEVLCVYVFSSDNILYILIKLNNILIFCAAHKQVVVTTFLYSYCRINIRINFVYGRGIYFLKLHIFPIFFVLLHLLCYFLSDDYRYNYYYLFYNFLLFYFLYSYQFLFSLSGSNCFFLNPVFHFSFI